MIHRQQGMQEKETQSVTNIDIEVNDDAVFNPNGDVVPLKYCYNDETLPKKIIIDDKEYLNIVDNSGKRKYNIGFTGLPDDTDYDLKVVLYDNNDNILDSRIVKVPYSEKILLEQQKKKVVLKWLANPLLYIIYWLKKGIYKNCLMRTIWKI